MCSTPVIGVNATAVAEVDWTYWYVDVLEPGEYGLLIRCGPSWVWSGNGDDQDGAGGIGTSEWPNYDIQKKWLSLMRNGRCGGAKDAHGLYNGGWWLDRSSVGRFPKIGYDTGGTFYYKAGDEGAYDLFKLLPRDKFQQIEYVQTMMVLLQKTKDAFTQIVQEFSAGDLQSLFEQTLHWFESTLSKQKTRLKMLYQDAGGKSLDLFVVSFQKQNVQDGEGHEDYPQVGEGQKIQLLKFQEKSTKSITVAHPRRRVTCKKPSALEMT